MLGKVVHCKVNSFDIYIGRPSLWGNPFSHVTDSKADWLVESREDAILGFRLWLEENEDPRAQYINENIKHLKGMTLGCWCAPQSCHGEILVEMANDYS